MLRTYPDIRKLNCLQHNLRSLHTASIFTQKYCCKLLIVGGGHGGTSVAHRFSRILNRNQIILVEPSQVHYYQPGFTLVGCGLRRLKDCARTTIGTIPEGVVWIKDEALAICPLENRVVMGNGDEVFYEYMIIAVGVALAYDKVKGLVDALENHSNVVSIFSSKYVEKTFQGLQDFKGETAIFTAPHTPTKCLAASFKICFMGEDYLRRKAKLENTDIIYASAQQKIFPVPIYEKTILDIAKRRRIELRLKTNLIEVVPERNEAIFRCENDSTKRIKYDFLHVTPPMYPPMVICECKELITKYKYVDVDMKTLQHKRYPNVFALGDCTPGLCNKTSSAVGVQSEIVYRNLMMVMQGHKTTATYDGYTACPILTSYGKCIMAEFDYNNERCETFPCDQNKESRVMYFLKTKVLPIVYWNLALNGRWNIRNNFLEKFRPRRK